MKSIERAISELAGDVANLKNSADEAKRRLDSAQDDFDHASLRLEMAKASLKNLVEKYGKK